MKIHFKNFQVKEVKNSSGIFSGENYQTSWRNFEKVNEGFGSVGGKSNHIENGHHIVKKNIVKNENQPKK